MGPLTHDDRGALPRRDADAGADPRTLWEARARGRLRSRTILLGPAFVAAVAYVDPGNFATNFQAGSRYGYELAWVIVCASLMAMLVQYTTSKVGLVTGRSLPDLCRERFGRRANLVLWLQAETMAMATDLAEFVGAAVGIYLLFGISVLPAGIVVAVVSSALLVLSNRGYRAFEVAIGLLLGVVLLAFGYVLFAPGDQDWPALVRGVVPNAPATEALPLAAGIVGATMMPHVVYLHSALQADRIRPANEADTRRLLRYNRWDCVAGLGLATLVNLAMLCIAAALDAGADGAGDLPVVHSELGRTIGAGAAVAFALALVASGLSSACVGTYSGQVVMAGFIGRSIPPVARRLVTMLPALVVLATVDDTSQALIWSQIVLSFGIPFALVPLLVISSATRTMGSWRNGRATTCVLSATVLVVGALNTYLVAASFAQ